MMYIYQEDVGTKLRQKQFCTYVDWRAAVFFVVVTVDCIALTVFVVKWTATFLIWVFSG